MFSTDFTTYRQREINEGVKIISDMFKNNTHPEYIQGSLALLKKILSLPKEIARTPEAIEIADRIAERDLKQFEIKFLRRFVD